MENEGSYIHFMQKTTRSSAHSPPLPRCDGSSYNGVSYNFFSRKPKKNFSQEKPKT